ncbi:MAG: NAD-binding protein [Candidatus Thalassarchaeaceae archaeon]|jgi:trk system potassium uptake protein TrkA|nr:NAD-binding protein [Candidatus Thalassarchaeaceae archaeon]
MRIIIGGAGEVGRGVARALQDEGQDLVLIDPDPDVIKEAQAIDAFVLLGDVTRREVLKEAGITDAGVFIAATGSDERNILSCALARDLLEEELPLEKNPKRPELLTMARIHDAGLIADEEDRLSRWAGVDVAICPHEDSIARLRAGLKSSSLNEVLPLGGDAWIVEVEVSPNASQMVNFTIAQADENIDGLPTPFTLCRKGERAFVPASDTIIEAGDRLVFATIGEHTFKRVSKAAGHIEPPYPETPRVAIFGATSLGRQLAESYLNEGCWVTVLDEKLEAANELVGSSIGSQKRLDVIHCNLGDLDLLKEVEIADHDIAIAALPDDHDNIAIAMRAADIGVERTGMILDDSNLARVVRRIGLTYAVSERRVAIDSILMHVHGRVPGHYQLMPSVPEIVAMSALISDDHSVIGETVGKIERKADAFRIAFVERENNDGSRLLLRPNNDMTVKSGDRLILFVASDDVPTIERILER